MSRLPPPYTIRRMEDADVAEVLQIWASLDLHEGTGTIQSFRRVDPGGFHVAVHSETGQILGMCAGGFVSPDTAFVGLYGVRAEMQGLGIGLSLWASMQKHVGERNAGLYAVIGKLDVYRDRAGFRVQDADRLLMIYESDSVTDATLDAMLAESRSASSDVEIVDLMPDCPESQPDLVNKVIEYDEMVHHYSRADLLRGGTLFEAGSRTVVALKSSSSSGINVVGYGTIRTNNIGKGMAGPLYADSSKIATRLLAELCDRHELVRNHGLLYMTLDSNPDGMNLASRLGLQHHSEEQLPRLFRHYAPEAEWNKIYGIHTPNFSLF